MVTPRRSEGGTRLYSDRDIQRLRLIKSLTDAGDFIGVVANLDDSQLSERLANLAGSVQRVKLPRNSVERLRLAVLGEALAERCGHGASVVATEVVQASDSLDDLLAALPGFSVEVLVASLELLGSKPHEKVARLAEASQGALVVVVYDFARRRTLAELSRVGAKLVHAPRSSRSLCRTLFEMHAAGLVSKEKQVGIEPSSEPVAPIFSRSQLAKIQDLPSRVECECPNHLATLVASLVGFERYTQTCIETQPDDAALHKRLAHGVGHARVLVEKLLIELCEYDELSV